MDMISSSHYLRASFYPRILSLNSSLLLDWVLTFQRPFLNRWRLVLCAGGCGILFESRHSWCRGSWISEFKASLVYSASRLPDLHRETLPKKEREEKIGFTHRFSPLCPITKFLSCVQDLLEHVTPYMHETHVCWLPSPGVEQVELCPVGTENV